MTAKKAAPQANTVLINMADKAAIALTMAITAVDTRVATAHKAITATVQAAPTPEPVAATTDLPDKVRADKVVITDLLVKADKAVVTDLPDKAADITAPDKADTRVEATDPVRAVTSTGQDRAVTSIDPVNTVVKTNALPKKKKLIKTRSRIRSRKPWPNSALVAVKM